MVTGTTVYLLLLLYLVVCWFNIGLWTMIPGIYRICSKYKFFHLVLSNKIMHDVIRIDDMIINCQCCCKLIKLSYLKLIIVNLMIIFVLCILFIFCYIWQPGCVCINSEIHSPDSYCPTCLSFLVIYLC